MRVVVTGSSGYLGSALVERLRSDGHFVRGVDVKESSTTDLIGSVADRDLMAAAVRGMDAVCHTAALHVPMMKTHSKADFVATNVTGTLNLLEESVAAGVKTFIHTSTTSVLVSSHLAKSSQEARHKSREELIAEAGEAQWVTEDGETNPRNIYGVTKLAAEHLCRLIHKEAGLPVVILRTSRFFPEEDIRPTPLSDENLKANEYLYRRGSLADMVEAHVCALARASAIGCGTYIITSRTPFTRAEAGELARDPDAVVARYFPRYREIYARKGWRMDACIDRVYVSRLAEEELGWAPTFNFENILENLERELDGR